VGVLERAGCLLLNFEREESPAERVAERERAAMHMCVYAERDR